MYILNYFVPDPVYMIGSFVGSPDGNTPSDEMYLNIGIVWNRKYNIFVHSMFHNSVYIWYGISRPFAPRWVE